MDAAIRRYGKEGGDAEAAEKLAKHLEQMGYNLNCDSFITKASSQKIGIVERYTADRTKAKEATDKYGKYPSRYNFDGVDSDEESSSDDDDDDDNEDSSDDSDDNDDSSDESSEEEEEEEEKVSSRRKPTLDKKNDFVRRMVDDSSNSMTDTRDALAQAEDGREATSRAQLKYVDEREGPVLLIAPNKEAEKVQRQAIPVTNRKRSGLGKMFKRDLAAKGSSSYSESSRARSVDLSRNGSDKQSFSQSNSLLEDKDAIQRQRSSATAASSSSKLSKGSSQSATSAKSPNSKMSNASGKLTETSKTSTASKKTESSKHSSRSKRTETSKKSKSSAKSASTKKSEISGLTETSYKRSKLSGATSIISTGLSRASSKTIKAGVRALSPGRAWKKNREIQTLHETNLEQDRDGVDGTPAAENTHDENDASAYITRSESSEDGPKEFSAIEAIGTIEATATMMNEGALEVPLKSQRTQTSEPPKVETVRTGQSESESKVPSRVIADTPITVMKDLSDDMKKNDIPTVPTEKTETSQSDDHGPVERPGPENLQEQVSFSGEELIRPPVWETVPTEKAEKPKTKGFFRRKSPQLTVNPVATLSSNYRPKTTERAIVDQASLLQQGSLIPHPLSPQDNEPTEPAEEVLIEGMSVVRQNELFDDQIFEGDNKLDMLRVDEAQKVNQPLLISPKPQSSPRRQRNHSRSPYLEKSRSSSHRRKTKKTKQKARRSPSPLGRRHSEEQKEEEPGPSVEFTFPPEEREYQPDPIENEVLYEKKEPKIKKFLGKIFSRKQKKVKTQEDTQNVGDLSVFEDEDGVEFRVRSPARSFEEKITEQVVHHDEDNKDHHHFRSSKNVAFADSVKVLTARHGDGDGIETKIPSDTSLLGSDPQLGEFLEVEVDNDANHAGEDEEALKQNRAEQKGVASSIDPSNSDGAQTIDTGAAVSNVADIVTAFGNFMRSLTASAEADDPSIAPIQIKSSLPIRLKKARSAAATFGDSNTVDTTVLQSEYPTSCRPNPEEETGHKKIPRKPIRSVSTLEGMRLASMSPTRKARYDRAGEEDMFSSASQASINVWPSPTAPNKPVPLKSALKSPKSKTKAKPNSSSVVASPSSFTRRTRSTPLITGPKSPASSKSVTHKPTLERKFFGQSPLVRKISSPTKKTQKYEARHDPVSSPTALASVNFSVMSPDSMTAVADPLSPSSFDGANSTVSSLKAPSNLGTPKDWATQDDEEEHPATAEEKAGWAEVNSAAHVLGKVIGQVENNQSIDTRDEETHVRLLLSEDSAMGDVEQALETLKRHAHRLGVRETDLLLAAVKSEDTEMLSVRSWTLGEELMDMINTYFRRR